VRVVAERDITQVTEAIHQALPEAIGEMVTAWSLVAETITEDGYRATWWLTAEGQLDSTTLGHVRHVDHAIAARMVVERMER
jgi:hypothetical protein